MKGPGEPSKRYSDKDLKEFEILIDEKIRQAQEQLDYYRNQIQEMGNNDDSKLKGLDDGTTTFESERVHTLAVRQSKLIKHLENAKLRIKNKVYGICRETAHRSRRSRLAGRGQAQNSGMDPANRDALYRGSPDPPQLPHDRQRAGNASR